MGHHLRINNKINRNFKINNLNNESSKIFNKRSDVHLRHKTTVLIFKIFTISTIFILIFYHIFIWIKPYFSFISVTTSILDAIKDSCFIKFFRSSLNLTSYESLESFKQLSKRRTSIITDISKDENINNSSYCDDLSSLNDQMMFVMFDIDQHLNFQELREKAVELNQLYYNNHDYNKHVNKIFEDTLIKHYNSKLSNEISCINLLKFDECEINKKIIEKIVKASILNGNSDKLIKIQERLLNKRNFYCKYKIKHKKLRNLKKNLFIRKLKRRILKLKINQQKKTHSEIN
jgi:hypothetical protein